MNRMSRCAALIGSLLSLSSFAQDCQEISLYKNGSEIGKMEEATSSFPESPEWATNWGNLGGMEPPYIRLSGQKDKAADWKGEFSFRQLPLNVQGGNLKISLRSTQKGDVDVWLVGNSGKGSTYTKAVEANRTYNLEIPVSSLMGNNVKSVSRIGVGLKNVPAYQYTTLFVDDISLDCISANQESSTGSTPVRTDFTVEDVLQYQYSDVHSENPVREGKFLKSKVSETSAAYGLELRQELNNSTNLDFVVPVMEQQQIKRFAGSSNLTPQESRDGWFRSLYLVERNRLREHVIANPKAIFYEAQTFAAANDNKAMPLLLGNVDYGYKVCLDTLCDQQKIVPGRVLLAGLPTATTRGSVIRLFYDPYFVTTNRKNLPQVEVFANGAWNQVLPKSDLEIRFPSAGIQRIQVRLTEGGLSINQNLFVEVK